MDGRPLKEFVFSGGAQCDQDREPSGGGDALREGSVERSLHTAGTAFIIYLLI